MYQANLVGDAQTPTVVALAHAARVGRLVVYVGAGVSLADPAGLPSGAEVAKRCVDRLSAHFDVPACDNADLVSVADAMAGLPGGLEAVRETAAEAADFTTAASNYAHQILALLLLEGLVDVLTTNWDNCIERGASPEQLSAIVTAADRLQLAHRAILKLHGCATRPSSLLLTSEHLDAPPDWVKAEMAGRLAGSQVIFVGIGDVAGYVKERIEEVMAEVGDLASITVVSPGIVANWAGSDWDAVAPTLPAEHRIPMAADEFMDSLAAAIIVDTLEEIATGVAGTAPLVTAFKTFSQALRAKTSRSVLSWVRAAGVGVGPGESVLQSENCARALLALGRLATDALTFPAPGRALVDGVAHEVLIGAKHLPVTRVRREAERRLANHLQLGGTGDDLVFLGSISYGAVEGIPPLLDVMGGAGVGDLLDGPLAPIPVFIDAGNVVAA